MSNVKAKQYLNCSNKIRISYLKNNYQGSPHLVKTSQLVFSLCWLMGEVRVNLGDFCKASRCPPTFHKTSVLHNNLKKDTMNEFRIKHWTSSPVWVKFQEHGTTFYMNIQEKVWLLLKKDWQGNFASLGEPCITPPMQSIIINLVTSEIK